MNTLTLLKFIKENHKIVQQYLQRAYNTYACSADTPYDRFRNCFLDAIVAAGGQVPFDKKLQAVRQFSAKFKGSFLKERKLSFEELCSSLNHDKLCEQNPDQLIANLFNELVNFKHIKQKKAAMFIRNIVLYSGADIFNNLEPRKFEEYLILPIDQVVQALLIRVFGDQFKNKLSGNPTAKDMEKICKMCKKIGMPLIWLDDLWFWGHFSMKKSIETGKHYAKRCKAYVYQLNEARLLTDLIIDEEFSEIVRDKTNQFAKIIQKI